jgi:uncharacterized membrane protein
MSDDIYQAIVAAFPTEDGAKDALKAVKEAKIKRANAAVLSKDKKGKLHVKEAHDWGLGKSAVVGGLAGAFLPGISIVLGAAGGAAAAKLIDGGLPDETLKHLGRGLTEEHSALVILVDSFDREAVERILLDNGGQIVSHELDASAADALAEAYVESGDESMEEAAVEEE